MFVDKINLMKRPRIHRSIIHVPLSSIQAAYCFTPNFCALFPGLKVQGRATSETDPKFQKFITQFEIQWKKDDASDWSIVDHVFKTNISDANKAEEVTFEIPIKARYLRIYPKSWQHQMCMRVELMKCTK